MVIGRWSLVVDVLVVGCRLCFCLFDLCLFVVGSSFQFLVCARCVLRVACGRLMGGVVC